jgi:hypothetical protein
MTNDFGDYISCVAKDKDKRIQMFTKSKKEHILVEIIEMGNKK